MRSPFYPRIPNLQVNRKCAVSPTDISCADGKVRLSLNSGGVGITLKAATTSAYLRVLSFDRV